jgi:hypothetical protein
MHFVFSWGYLEEVVPLGEEGDSPEKFHVLGCGKDHAIFHGKWVG